MKQAKSFCFFVSATFMGHSFCAIWDAKTGKQIKEIKGDKRAAMARAKELGYQWNPLDGLIP